MRKRLSDYQEQYGDLYNLEATPAESTSYRFAKHDKEQFPDIITANMNGTPYYTNSSHLPVGYTDDIFSALDVQDELQTLYTSGTVFHGFLGEKLPTWQAAANLVRKIAENYRLPYYTLSPTYSVCKDHGYLTGEQSICPHCGKPAEVYSRITGYYRPVQNWNDGKAQEFRDRQVYEIERSRPCQSCMVDTDKVTKAESDVAMGINCNGLTLFATKTCPNCKQAEKLLTDNGIKYTKMFVEDYPEVATVFGIKQAPTIINTKNGAKTPIVGVGAIRRYVLKHKSPVETT